MPTDMSFYNVKVSFEGSKRDVEKLRKAVINDEYPEITDMRKFLCEKTSYDYNDTDTNFDVYPVVIKLNKTKDYFELKKDFETFIPFDPFRRLMKNFPDMTFIYNFQTAEALHGLVYGAYFSVFHGDKEVFNRDDYFNEERYERTIGSDINITEYAFSKYYKKVKFFEKKYDTYCLRKDGKAGIRLPSKEAELQIFTKYKYGGSKYFKKA